MGIRYAIAVANGKFHDDSVLSGLITVTLKKMDREAKGKAMTNFKQPAGLDEFIQSLHMTSPRAYKLVAKQFPVRSDRSCR